MDIIFVGQFNRWINIVHLQIL